MSHKLNANETIYHYCSLETLLNILKNNTIRITDITKMNDYSEKKWFYKNVIDSITEPNFLQNYHFPNLDQINSALKNVSETWTGYLLPETYQEYIMCFSSDGDILSQWRGYANDGQGVAIGFNKETIEKLAVENNTHTCFSLKKVEYIEDFQTLKPIFSIMALFIKESSNDISKYEDIIIENIRKHDIASTKNPAFKEEKEWRLIFNPDNLNEPDKKFSINNFIITKTNYRATDNKIIGYKDIDFSYYKNKIINRIILGPKCKATQSDMRELFINSGYPSSYSDLVIENSKATYE